MTIYFAQTRIDPTKVKIGFTGDVEARRVNMSVSVPGGIIILATLEGGKEGEDYLHEKFAEHNVGGEWFEYDEAPTELKPVIMAVAKLEHRARERAAA